MESPSAATLEGEREHAQVLVGEAYAREILDQDEVDRRMEAIQSALSVEEVHRLVEDLGPVAAVLVPPRESSVVVVPPLAPRLSAVFSSLERVGPWTLGPHQDVRVVLGSVTLDLRTVVWATDTAVIRVDVILSSLDVIVPPGVAVDVDCAPLFSSVDIQDSVPARPQETGRPRRVRLEGRVVFGSVSVREQFAGEGSAAAWWRRLRERRALARRRAKALMSADDGKDR